MDYKVLGHNIRDARKSLSLTQEQLAEKIDVSTVFISQIENGTRKPSLETLLKLSSSLGVKIDTLIDKSSDLSDNDDINRLNELLSMCSNKERRFVTEVANEMIIRLLGNRVI